jgi:MFS family permease
MTTKSTVKPTSDLMEATKAKSLPQVALLLVITRGLSSIGTTLTTFGLNVWIYRQTGSYTVFATMAVFAMLPVLLFAPFAGVLTDRFDKRKLLIAADVVSGVVVMAVLALYLLGGLGVPSVAVAILLLAMAGELRWSSMSALFSQVVPREQLNRINGIQQSFRGINVMLGPLLGAVGLDLVGLPLLLGIDVVTYALSVAAIYVIDVSTCSLKHHASTVPDGFLSELTFGFKWVWQRPGLRRLLLFFMVVNVGLSIFTATFTPYVLSIASNHVLGICLGTLGGGAFFAGMYLARRKSMSQRFDLHIVLGALTFGATAIVWGISRHPVALILSALLIGMVESVVMAASQTTWQKNVPAAIQGKVFAVRTVVAFGFTPLAILGSIPLASTVFEPMLRQNNSVASVIWGTAPTGSLGMMVSFLGFGIASFAGLIQLTGGLRLAEGDGNSLASEEFATK